jgi:hypothetical protein
MRSQGFLTVMGDQQSPSLQVLRYISVWRGSRHIVRVPISPVEYALILMPENGDYEAALKEVFLKTDEDLRASEWQ